MTGDPIGVPGRIAVATALVSFAGLGCEIVLMRIFSFVTWYHFVYLVIGLTRDNGKRRRRALRTDAYARRPRRS